ncbi:microsomal dipeptidase-like Zn-dependent dipeptidase [Pseudomonas sp. JUb42]|jgi:microsomal dipeptidase-like Zn-dependent dipeptidase|uniref:dipeptidase n=1 Tax=Pseudomonas sp. JUb42 TaxID=2940611 RepID=UPI002169FBFE|nr:dipeptidase [Pseudomonas sp. JUb42]MCS3472370.1 microsomal dipeptidase-like Zn-dependent dipeptidase [Pseudomonas sp. JUb42]
MTKHPQQSRKWPWAVALSALVLIAAAGAWWYWVYRHAHPFSRDIEQRANALQERILSLDAHLDVPLNYGSDGREANRDGPTRFDLVKAAKGRLRGASIAIWSWPEFWSGPNWPHRPTAGFQAAMANELEVRYRIITSIARDFPEQAGIAYSPADFRRLAGEGKFAIIISMLNAAPLGDDIDKLNLWAARGMRVFGPGYVGNNSWVDSARPLPFLGDSVDPLGGLSDIGRRAVSRLNDLGVVIDVSQMSSQALSQITQLSRAPVIASHTGVQGMMDIRRNLSDADLASIKATDGLVNIVAYSKYLKPFSRKTIEKMNELRARYNLPDVQNQTQMGTTTDPVFSIWSEKKFGEYLTPFYDILGEEPEATLADYVDSIDYAVKKIGIDHVGISSDFNDGGGVEGWENVSQVRNVTAELMQRGYSDEDIAKLWGGNFLRVWEAAQKAAAPAAAAIVQHSQGKP